MPPTRIKDIKNNSQTFCGEFDEIDQTLLRRVIVALGPAEQKVYAHIFSGGFWHEQQLSEIDRSNGLCKPGGDQVSSTDHTLWECPMVNKHRKHKALADIQHKHLHKASRNGILPAMSYKLLGCLCFPGPEYGDIKILTLRKLVDSLAIDLMPTLPKVTPKRWSETSKHTSSIA